MSKDQNMGNQDHGSGDTQPDIDRQAARPTANEVDGLADKKPEDLTPEELRLMADTMPGEGPGD